MDTVIEEIQKDTRSQDLAKKPIKKLLWQFALSLITLQILNTKQCGKNLFVLQFC